MTCTMISEIINIDKSYKKALNIFLQKLYPHFTDIYIKYCVDEACNVENPKSLLVINDKKEIVGCHLFFHTEAWIKGERRNVFWGHDTFLKEEYRRDIGLDFVLDISSVKDSFGYNLSFVNYKIQKRCPTTTILESGVRKYCLFNLWLIWGITRKYLKKVDIPNNMPNTTKSCGMRFLLCPSSEQIDIPVDGFWNKEYLDVDFIRDTAFLNKRFFNNPVHHYYVYTNDKADCYFVVRPILFKGILSLFLVDYRYDMGCPKMLRVIFNSVKSICHQMHIGIMLFTTNDKNAELLFSKTKWCKTYKVDFVANNEKGILSHDKILVTAADSDGDFQK